MPQECTAQVSQKKELEQLYVMAEDLHDQTCHLEGTLCTRLMNYSGLG